MRSSIKIIKRKHDQDSDAGSSDLITPEGEKSVDRGTREIVSTVKSWISELKERKRAQGNSFSPPPVTKATVIVITLVFAVGALLGSSPRNRALAQKPSDGFSNRQPAIKVAITSVDSATDQPMDHYSVGDQIRVKITMTNTSTEPLYACISSDLYQNVPKLTKDGKVLPYMKWQSYEQLTAHRNHTCQHVNLPESILLRPNEPETADWFVLVDGRVSTGADAWYDSLLPGKYELLIQRLIDCCDGPVVESNKISFEVAPSV